MRQKELKAESSGLPPAARRRRPAFAWVDVRRSALWMLAISVPTMAVEEDWHGHPMIDDSTHLWLVAAGLVVVAFLVGGILAGYRRPSAATMHATAAAALAVSVLLLAALARRLWLAHEGVPGAVAQLWCYAVGAAFVLSVAGSRLGRRLAPGHR
ncbi:MAG TPA: hypothetical protein VKA05_09190 [Acidimicrobiales bacterium]|nr:hypothetical protein [Acidimicrobiales bacterium]